MGSVQVESKFRQSGGGLFLKRVQVGNHFVASSKISASPKRHLMNKQVELLLGSKRLFYEYRNTCTDLHGRVQVTL